MTAAGSKRDSVSTAGQLKILAALGRDALPAACDSGGRENWERYVYEGEEVEKTPMEGHLMRYPVDVGGDGTVGPLQGHELFPDVGGRVLGSTNKFPDHLTM